MITKPKPAHALLPGFVLAACAALPGGSAAQSATPAKGPGTLGAAMAEALRTPFHATNGAGGLAIFQPSGVPVPHAGDRQVRDSARGPSFHRVFWPTLVAAPLSHWAGIFLSYVGCYGNTSDAQCRAGILAGGAIAVLLPATVSRIAGGSFAKGTLGSAVGGGLGFGLWYLLEGSVDLEDDSVAYWLAVSITHAFFTTAFSRHRTRTP